MSDKKAMSETKKKVGERLGELRIEKRITQADLGELLGVTYSTYSYYESGGRELNYERLIKLADYFDVSVDYILGRTEDKTPIVSEEVLAVYERIKRDELFASIFNAYIKLNRRQKQQLYGYVTGLKEKAYEYDDRIDVGAAKLDINQTKNTGRQVAVEAAAPAIKAEQSGTNKVSAPPIDFTPKKDKPMVDTKHMPPAGHKQDSRKPNMEADGSQQKPCQWNLDTGYVIIPVDCGNNLQRAKEAADKILRDRAADPLLQRKDCPIVGVFLDCDGDLKAYREWSDKSLNKGSIDAYDCVDYHRFGYLGRWKDL